jgi:nucleoside phosphorylase
MADLPTLSHQEYTIGWISALPLELAAGQSMLDAEHDIPPHDPHDHNTYTFGRIGKHNVVMACLPAGATGITSAAKVAMQMQHTFQRLEFGLMVGVGGGVPNEEHDVRLGDVVVSQPTETHGGVIQYDLGKTTQEGLFLRTGTLNKPPGVLLTALSSLQAKHLQRGSDFMSYMSLALENNPSMADKFTRPPDDCDVLYEAYYDHPKGNPTCSKCVADKQIPRTSRTANHSIAHYGLIASANQVMRHGATREKLRQEARPICFDMEAAGLMDDFRCLVIRGICDYADSHKNKIWQPHSALAAACYAKELLYTIPGRRVTATGIIAEAVDYPGKYNPVETIRSTCEAARLYPLVVCEFCVLQRTRTAWCIYLSG